jgi:hypothetical protein
MGNHVNQATASGVNVTITDFSDFRRFSAKKKRLSLIK